MIIFELLTNLSTKWQLQEGLKARQTSSPMPFFFFSHTSTSINFYVNYNCGENKTEKQKMRVVKVSIKDVGCLDLYCRMFPDY